MVSNVPSRLLFQIIVILCFHSIGNTRNLYEVKKKKKAVEGMAARQHQTVAFSFPNWRYVTWELGY